MAEAPRRSTRKRRAAIQEPDAATEEDVDAVIANAELALESAAKMRSNKAKRRRAEAHARKPPFESIPVDLLPTILLFLDSARDVYNLAKCSKQLRKAITPEIVVRSAVFSGGKTREAIGDVMNAVNNRSIHVPSTLRLLRLVNAKKCERLEECVAYNLVKQAPADRSKSAARPFGLAICPECAKFTSTSILPNGRDHYARHDRVALYQWSRILNEPHTEVATGERAGPFVFAKKLLQINKTYRKDEERKQALESALEQVDANEPTEDEARAEAFLDAYETAEQEFPAFDEAKRRAAEGKAAERAGKKIKNVRAVYAKLEQLFDGYAHKDLVLECTWNEQLGTCGLKHRLVDLKLGPLLYAPSGATQKKLTAASESVREVFDLLQSQGIIGPNFLAPISGSRLRHERALYRYCLTKFTSSELLRNASADHRFLELLREGNLVDALIRVLTFDDDLELAFARQVALGSLASSPIAGAQNQQESLLVKKRLEKLAIRVWSEKVRRPWEIRDAEMFRQTYAQCRSEFLAITAAIQRYMEHPQTVAFLSETGPPPNHPNQVFTRQNAVDKVYEDAVCLRRLREGDFEGLRIRHQRMFLYPELYGFSRNAN